MIETRGLTKKYDGFQALSGLDMTVPSGSIYGLIGINGSGKTTVLRHLAGVLRQDAGEIRFDGEDVWKNAAVKQHIGLVPDDLFFPNGYNLAGMKKIFAGSYAAWDDRRFHEMTQAFRLSETARLRNFSKGMKKQAMFCLVMSTMPKYLLLDEPIDGLDPIVRKLVWKYIVDDVADREMSVLVSSHNLREMEGICDHIGILSAGSMKLEREMDSLRGDLHKVQIAFGADAPENPFAGLNVLHHEKRGSVELLLISAPRDEIESRLRIHDPLIFDILPLSLEEIFIYELGGDDDEISSLIF